MRNKTYKLPLFTSITVLLFLFGGFRAHAEIIKCPNDSKAIYKPYLSYQNERIDYDLVFEERRCDVDSCPLSKVYLNTYKKQDKSLLSTLEMDYGCGGGDMPWCRLGFSPDDHNKRSTYFNIVGISSKFDAEDISISSVPYALAIPSISVQLNYIRAWSGFKKNMKFFTKEKVSPNATTPEIWIFNSCIKK